PLANLAPSPDDTPHRHWHIAACHPQIHCQAQEPEPPKDADPPNAESCWAEPRRCNTQPRPARPKSPESLCAESGCTARGDQHSRFDDFEQAGSFLTPHHISTQDRIHMLE